MKTIASLYEVRPGVFRAKVLYPNQKAPVEFFRQDHEVAVATWLIVDGIVADKDDILPNKEFEREVDMMVLFGCRTDAPMYETERLTDKEIETILNHGERVLDSAMQQIDNLEREYRALLPRSAVDDRPQ